jgi:ubiquinone/menaquinone biosynthesis C-methylase UbiE
MELRSWVIDELEHAGDEHLDSSYVQAYDTKARFDPAGDLAILQDLGLGPASTLIDYGAGTGELALAAAEVCRRVVAVDVSMAMLDVVRAKARHRGTTNLEVVRGGFLSYAHTGEPADIIYTRNALHHLPDFWKALAIGRMASFLRSGGILRLRDLMFSFEPEEADRVVQAWLDTAPDRPESGWTRSELETHLRSEYSTFTWLLEPMLERAGFEIRNATYDESRVFAAYSCAKR